MDSMVTRVKVIAIDGPVASGKTVVGRALAQQLGFKYLDTGIMYRAITWLALQSSTVVDDQPALEKLAQENPIKITGRHGENIQIGGQRLSVELREPSVNGQVSLVSQFSGVRRVLVRQQRVLAEEGEIVMVGRDIGTVVLPNADFKVYLTASIQERANRRWQEMMGEGRNVELNQVVRETEERDRLDSQREDSPLKPAQDAWVLDTSNLVVDQVVKAILDRTQELERSSQP